MQMHRVARCHPRASVRVHQRASTRSVLACACVWACAFVPALAAALHPPAATLPHLRRPAGQPVGSKQQQHVCMGAMPSKGGNKEGALLAAKCRHTSGSWRSTRRMHARMDGGRAAWEGRCFAVRCTAHRLTTRSPARLH
eukprot:38457-Chlamydomonas_euryale.AAC.12